MVLPLLSARRISSSGFGSADAGPCRVSGALVSLSPAIPHRRKQTIDRYFDIFLHVTTIVLAAQPKNACHLELY